MEILKRSTVIVPMIIAILASVISPVFAQDAIDPGDNRLVQILQDQPASLTISGQLGQVVNLDLLAITPGLIPEVSITDDQGELLQTITNPGGLNRIADQLVLDRHSTLQLTVSSASGVGGQLALSLSEVDDVDVRRLALSAGESLERVLTSEQPLQQYVFRQTPGDALILTIKNQGTRIVVLNRESGEREALVGRNMRAIQLRFEQGTSEYLIITRSSNRDSEASYTLELRTESAARSSLESSPQLPEADPICMVTPRSQNVNIRSNPGLGSAIIGSLRLGTRGEALERLAASDWYHINVSGLSGWVASSVTVTEGACDQLAKAANVVVQDPLPLPPPPADDPAPPPVQPTPSDNPLPITPQPTPPADPEPTPEPTQPANPITPSEPKADIVIDAIVVGGDRPDDLTFTLNLRNQGNAPSPPFVIAVTAPTGKIVQAPGLIRDVRTVGVILEPGSTTSITTAAFMFEPGRHQIEAVADTSGHVDELNEGNNTLTRMIGVQGIQPISPPEEQLPDLEIPFFDVSYYEELDTVIAKGGIENRGLGPSGPSTMMTVVDGVVVERYGVPAIEGERGVDLGAEIGKVEPGQTITITITADVDGVVAESNETNNTWTMSYTRP